ncbi:MAG: LPS-assembly protein LptD [Cyclobacteriaceae bacterium]|nr:LPS-assembly protein LptD [Cyclobacteriaceae bacterium]
MNFSLKTKFLAVPFPNTTVRFVGIFFLLITVISSYGQVEKPVASPKGDLKTLPKDSIGLKQDTARVKSDSLARKKKGDIETTINYSARDSINSSLDRKIVHLYGDAKIKYGEVELIAEEITIDYEQSTITANGRQDTLGRWIGYPIFTNSGEKYETKKMIYNIKTKKALITEVVTKQGEGFLHGQAVFKNEKNELLSLRNAYTTCDLAHPHYQIIASKAKAIPGDKIVVGPFHMEFNDVPLPLGFAFGIFPSPRQSSSGIIVPAYGEENNRGFFLRNGGYFFDISDYFKLQLTGDIYSKGSSGLYINTSYRSRYSYSGNFNFSYTNNRLTSNIEDPNTVKDFRVTWSHTPLSRGSGRFSASVNAATASYNLSNFLPLASNSTTNRIDATSRKLSSNISYSKTFGSIATLGINYRINQDLITKQVDMPLPDLSFNLNNLYPLKKVSESMIFQNLSMRYTMTATNQITNNLGRIDINGTRQPYLDLSGNPITHDSIAPFNFTNLPTFIRNANKGVRHTIPLSTSFKFLNFFTISPSFNYDEIWYFDKTRWKLSDDSTAAVIDRKEQGFNRLVTYSTSVNLTTRIYGTYFFKRAYGVQAIRHIINPTIGYSYTPNFADPKYEYFDVLRLKNAKYDTYKSVHEGYTYGGARTGTSSVLSFGINNTIEMKVKSKKDTVAKKIPIFNTLSINSGYNFAADSFRLQPFSLAANTNVLNDKLNVNLSAVLDPYQYVKIYEQAKYDSVVAVGGSDLANRTQVVEIQTRNYAWESTQAIPFRVIKESNFGIGRITSANLALSTNFSSKGQKKDNDTRDKILKSNAPPAEKQYLIQNPDSYVDFDIPWNLRLSYNANYSHSVNSTPKVTQSLRFNGDFSLTKAWKVTYNSGYDFEAKEITTTQLGITRDLHCWTVNLSWVPFGRFTSYTFFIGVKSSLLKDLKLNRTRSFYDL